MKKEDFDINDDNYNPYELDEEDKELLEEINREAEENNAYKTKSKEEEDEEKNKKVILILLFFILLGLGFFIYFKYIRNMLHGGYMVAFNSADMTIKEGETKPLEYTIYDENPTESISFNSDNETVVTVDDDGNVTGMKVGFTTVNIIYVDYEDNPYVDTILVNVIEDDTPKPPTPKPPTPKPPTDYTKPEISIKLLEGSPTEWNNSNVKVQILVTDKYGIKSLRYDLNGSGFTNINNKETITISDNGETTIKALAINTKGKQSSRSLVVKIDKETPVLTLVDGKTTYESNDSIQVCANCSDKYSGCKQETYCKTFSSSANNITIEGEDNANNKSKTNTFNVKITVPEPEPEVPAPPVVVGKPSCSLSVSSSGTVSASARADAGIAYKGFSSSYSGSNSTSKSVSSSTTVTYYVKDNNGQKNTCSIKVVKSTSYSCPSGYTKYDTNKCKKQLRAAHEKGMTLQSTTYTTSCSPSYGTTVVKCESVSKNLCDGKSGCRKKLTYKVNYVCPTGSLSGKYCYDYKNASSSTRYSKG